MHYRDAAMSLALCAALAVTGCSGLMAAGSAAGAVGGAVTTANQVAAAVDPAIAAACRQYAKGKAAADALVAAKVVPVNSVAKVESIEAFGDAACAHPPDGNALSTAIWLGQLAGEISALTSTAKPAD